MPLDSFSWAELSKVGLHAGDGPGQMAMASRLEAVSLSHLVLSKLHNGQQRIHTISLVTQTFQRDPSPTGVNTHKALSVPQNFHNKKQQGLRL